MQNCYILYRWLEKYFSEPGTTVAFLLWLSESGSGSAGSAIIGLGDTWQTSGSYSNVIKQSLNESSMSCFTVTANEKCAGLTIILKTFTSVFCKQQWHYWVRRMSTEPSTFFFSTSDNISIAVTNLIEPFGPTRNILLSSSLQSFLELCFQGTLNLFWST